MFGEYGALWIQTRVNAGPERLASGVVSNIKVINKGDNQPLCGEPATATPVADYCASVDGYEPGEEIGLELPMPIIGPATCFGVDEITLGLSLLNLIPGIDDMDDVTFPGMQVCARAIEFGDLQLFGLLVNLDVIAALMAGVFLFRLALRS
jgi:hypothetical protein